MLILCAVFAILLLGGSLYPWHFHSGPDLTSAAMDVLSAWPARLERSMLRDILVNLVIYIPIGFTGFLWPGWRSRTARWTVPLLAGTTLSFCVETLQHYFPPRMPSTPDLLCNACSTAAGLILASVFESVLESRHIQWRRRHSIHLSSALLLLLLWGASLAWPERIFPLAILPKIRLLLRGSAWSPLEMVAGALPWLLAGELMVSIAGARMRGWWLWGLLFVLYPLQLVMPGHTFTWSAVAGSVIAVGLLTAWPGLLARQGPVLTCGWLLWIVLDGLRPYRLLQAPNDFQWVPFLDMITSNWMVSVGVLLHKTWIYGAAFWLLTHTGRRRSTAAVLVVSIVTAVEAAQCWLPRRAPGFTDPAIVLLAAALLALVDRRYRITSLPRDHSTARASTFR
ncbi:VanZ family protein [Paludibaculum fermentans]|uniref:VanZ family protein n=1 Tax=Paludibaculum fermentans TaxID=1473598 RepID=UPI003EB7601C